MQPREGCVPLRERLGQVNACAAAVTAKKHAAANGTATLPFTGTMVTAHGMIMRSNLAKITALALLYPGLAACAAGSDTYPSLAIRPAELGLPAEPPVPAGPIRPATSAARLAALRSTAASADAAFAARAAQSARLAQAAAGQPFESNARAEAMVALADLDGLRAATAGALAEIDVLAAEAAGALSPDPALTALQAEVAATLAREDATIARHWAIIGT